MSTEHVQEATGWWGYVFTGNFDLAKKIGLRTNQRIEFYNSSIRSSWRTNTVAYDDCFFASFYLVIYPRHVLLGHYKE